MTLSPGLNIVAGSITTGKTSFLQLIRILLGSGVRDLIPELRENVPAIAGNVTIGSQDFDVVRPLVSTLTAPVEIAGPDDVALRLPALQREDPTVPTYGEWLLERLDLPRLQVPSAPTQPTSAPTPVSINDYMAYCHLDEGEIASSVFGHTDHYRNVKRKYVFEILYGLYGVETALVQEQLRQVDSRIRQIEIQSQAVAEFLVDTPLANAAVLDQQLRLTQERLSATEDTQRNSSRRSAVRPEVQATRAHLLEVDHEIATAQADQQREAMAIDTLKRLEVQLRAQSARLTRAIVAETTLLDFEFVICPRCGSDVSPERGSRDTCLLCLQPPQLEPQRIQLIAEQDRIGQQLTETAELLDARRRKVETATRRIVERQRERDRVASELAHLTQTFVSDEAQRIRATAAERATLLAELATLQEYRAIHERFGNTELLLRRLRAEREELVSALDAIGGQPGDVGQRISRLEALMAEILERFNAPRFGSVRSVRIDRETYLPVIDNRRFDQLSSAGLQVLVNVAHALAHHVVALELDLPLPGLLLIDGLTSHVGHEGLDRARVEAVYAYLLEVSDTWGDGLQLIVADHDVPHFAADAIALELSPRHMLVPT